MERKVALVTGSSRGIGKAIAEGLSLEGIKVVVNYRENAHMAQEVVKQINDKGGEAIALKADVSDEESVKSMVETIIRKYGSIDILVNNAATHKGGRIHNLKREDWDTVINSVLGGAFNCTKYVIPYMMEKKWGRIINISSYVGLHGFPGDSAYGAAKAGLIGFTKSLAKEVAKEGITVNVVVPGFIPTDMTSALFNTPEKLERELQRIPMKRPGKPEEIADIVSFLVFKGEYITGAVIRVDGGLGM